MKEGKERKKRNGQFRKKERKKRKKVIKIEGRKKRMRNTVLINK